MTTPGRFNTFESTAADAITGRIFTKLAGAAFALDIVALNDAGTAVLTTFAGEVKVELLNASNNAGTLDANNCRPDWTAIPGTLVANPVSSSATMAARRCFTDNDACPRCVWAYLSGYRNADRVGCSTDNFTIRPTAFTGVTSNMTNTGTSGTPKVGQVWTLLPWRRDRSDALRRYAPDRHDGAAGASTATHAGALTGVLSPLRSTARQAA